MEDRKPRRALRRLSCIVPPPMPSEEGRDEGGGGGGGNDTTSSYNALDKLEHLLASCEKACAGGAPAWRLTSAVCPYLQLDEDLEEGTKHGLSPVAIPAIGGGAGGGGAPVASQGGWGVSWDEDLRLVYDTDGTRSDAGGQRLNEMSAVDVHVLRELTCDILESFHPLHAEAAKQLSMLPAVRKREVTRERKETREKTTERGVVACCGGRCVVCGGVVCAVCGCAAVE